MSVPLDAIAIHDTDERIAHARKMKEYHRVAREELEHILTFQQEHSSPSSAQLVTRKPAKGSLAAAEDADADADAISPVAVPPGLARSSDHVQINTWADKPASMPRKVSARFKDMFTLKKASTTDDFSDIRRAMGDERMERPELERPRTADPREGGQLPEEDSWDWYTRNINALPPMPSPTHPASVAR